MYCNNLVDYHLVMDLVPALSRLYFLHRMGDTHLSAVQSAILVGLDLQYKTVDALAAELKLPASQLLGLFNRTLRQCVQYLMSILEQSIERSFVQPRSTAGFNPVGKSMQEEVEEAAKELKQKQQLELQKL